MFVSSTIRRCATAGLALLFCVSVHAQQTTADLDWLTLPEAPQPASSSSTPPLSPAADYAVAGPGHPRRLKMASPFDKYILPGQPAPHLTPGDKVVIGLRDSVTPFSAVGWVTAATWEEIIDGPPNYGENSKGYVQRIGAAAARGASENFFTASVFANVFHQDPRYYKMGDGHSTAHRLIYAATRTFVTRDDRGHEAPNYSLLAGNLAGTALTQAYYPPVNRGAGDFGRTYGDSLLGTAAGFIVSEFLADALTNLHLQFIHVEQ